MNKLITVINSQVFADGENIGTVQQESTETPQLFYCFSETIPAITIEGIPTGESVTIYYVWNGRGWAQITGDGEQVTIHNE